MVSSKEPQVTWTELRDLIGALALALIYLAFQRKRRRDRDRGHE